MSYQADDMQDIYRLLDSKPAPDLEICAFDYLEYNIKDMVRDINLYPPVYIAVENIVGWVRRMYPKEERNGVLEELRSKIK